MTKQALQKELKEKVKAGVKPSDIKKLKRSKSADDITSVPTPSLSDQLSLKRIKSVDDIPNPPISSTLKIEQLEDKISVLELKLETKDRDLEALQTENQVLKKNPLAPLVQDQLNQKQTELESLKATLEKTTTELNQTKQQLDNSLTARLNALSDWNKQYEKAKQLATELEKTISQASAELDQGDNQITQLRTKLFQATQQTNSLQRELNLNRINRGNSNSPTTSPNNYETKLDYFQYALYALMAVWFMLALNSSWKIPTNNNQNA